MTIPLPSVPELTGSSMIQNEASHPQLEDIGDRVQTEAYKGFQQSTMIPRHIAKGKQHVQGVPARSARCEKP